MVPKWNAEPHKVVLPPRAVTLAPPPSVFTGARKVWQSRGRYLTVDAQNPPKPNALAQLVHPAQSPLLHLNTTLKPRVFPQRVANAQPSQSLVLGAAMRPFGPQKAAVKVAAKTVQVRPVVADPLEPPLSVGVTGAWRRLQVVGASLGNGVG